VSSEQWAVKKKKKAVSRIPTNGFSSPNSLPTANCLLKD
jgi:hypothetical protein